MDLNLSLSYQEQNDNKAIILTDTTNNWNSSTINIGEGEDMVLGVMYEIVSQAGVDFNIEHEAPNNNPGTRFISSSEDTLEAGDELTPVTPNFNEITRMTLNTTITGVSGIGVAKSEIDLFSEFNGPFSSQTDLVFTITALLLGDTVDSLLEDGLYELTYDVGVIINAGTEYTQQLVVTILVYGQVKIATYEKLRNISTFYMCNDGAVKEEISEADLCGAYLSSIENSAYVAKTEELLNMLIVLDNIIKNDSNITW